MHQAIIIYPLKLSVLAENLAMLAYIEKKRKHTYTNSCETTLTNVTYDITTTTVRIYSTHSPHLIWVSAKRHVSTATLALHRLSLIRVRTVRVFMRLSASFWVFGETNLGL